MLGVQCVCDWKAGGGGGSTRALGLNVTGRAVSV